MRLWDHRFSGAQTATWHFGAGRSYNNFEFSTWVARRLPEAAARPSSRGLPRLPGTKVAVGRPRSPRDYLGTRTTGQVPGAGTASLAPCARKPLERGPGSPGRKFFMVSDRAQTSHRALLDLG